ncbi:MAG: hypothetical protein G3M78_07735 [Candidatus Nitrohelix vancouverensis]|uniref:Uncharacterized protein n=1 Tax=Candidatus Nitrohelix vancouverensis TaxID=2705534 RepID=A0A7T0G3F6_9BACT|nr:MAG: hypothetical protein G3M78_07735 [Candidatus Nitrohelix vancouverensis]
MKITLLPGGITEAVGESFGELSLKMKDEKYHYQYASPECESEERDGGTTLLKEILLCLELACPVQVVCLYRKNYAVKPIWYGLKLNWGFEH